MHPDGVYSYIWSAALLSLVLISDASSDPELPPVTQIVSFRADADKRIFTVQNIQNKNVLIRCHLKSCLMSCLFFSSALRP